MTALDPVTVDAPAHVESGGTDITLTPHFVDLALDAITLSQTNPRKHFDAAALAELAESMRTHGLAQPILVRPTTNAGPGVDYELVAGERRLRAARQIGWPTIPSIVRPLTDLQALELQVIENLQRADLHPLEEAEGYEQLMQRHGFTVDVLVAKVGKSKSYVYMRLKLTALGAKARKAFYAGKLDATAAVVVARIPHEKLQDEAVKQIVDQGMNFRQVTDYVQRHYMLRLADAPFSTSDATLYPEAGPCTTCPKRTGNQPELFGDVKGPDVCTDPRCFDVKRTNRVRIAIAEAKTKGLTVVDGKKAKEVFPYSSAYSAYGGYSMGGEHLGADPKNRTVAKLAKVVDVAPTLVLHPTTGDLHEVYDEKLLTAKLKAAGEISPRASRSSGGANAADLARQRKAKESTEIALRTLRATSAAMGASAAYIGADTRTLAHWCLEQLGFDRLGRLGKLRGWDKSWSEYGNGRDALRVHVDALDEADLALLIFDCMWIGEVYCAPYNASHNTTGLDTVADRLGVDRAAIAREVAAEFAPKKPAAKNGSKASAAAAVPIKYRNDATGETWTGRGRAPKWIEGRDRAPFTIAEAA